jgi:hypothetical protein
MNPHEVVVRSSQEAVALAAAGFCSPQCRRTGAQMAGLERGRQSAEKTGKSDFGDEDDPFTEALLVPVR